MPTQSEIDAATAAISTTIRPEWRREVARTALAAAEAVRDKAWMDYLARHEHTPERWIGEGHMTACPLPPIGGTTTEAMDEVRRQMRPTAPPPDAIAAHQLRMAAAHKAALDAWDRDHREADAIDQEQLDRIG